MDTREGESVVVVRKGQLFWSSAVVAAIAGGIASFLLVRMQVDDVRSDVKQLQMDAKIVATKEDVRALSDRIDRALEMLIEKQEARPYLPSRSRP